MTKHTTISRTHQNTAAWHYGIAAGWYERYLKYLDDDGLMHPNDLRKARWALSNFRLHSQIGDHLMDKGKPVTRRVRPYKPETKLFADDFELALIQRGQTARQAFIDGGGVILS
jgi:hypothetical protein